MNARDSYRSRLLSQEKTDRKKLEEAERRLEEALDQYRELLSEVRENNPGYAALTQPQPLSVAEIQGQLLDSKALLLEYELGTKRSFLWVVTPDSVQTFELPGRDRIEGTARRYYGLVTARNETPSGESLQARKQRIDHADAEAERLGRELYRLLLAPAKRLLKDRPLLIVADGALPYIPFTALPISSSGAPLATRHEVVSLPSASTLAVLRREVRNRSRASKALALFADPVFEATDERLTHQPIGQRNRMRLMSATRGDWSPADARQAGAEHPSFRRLPSSLKEARTISALLPPDQVFLATGFAASRSQATSPGLAQYRNVHFATHGVLDSRHPELSKLVFSLIDENGKPQDGFLRLNDIYNLRLGADLVVLSACQTALGKEIRGEGLIGLTRGFMYAGAARVVASLWSVEDRATADLMGSFYRAMLRQKLSQRKPCARPNLRRRPARAEGPPLLGRLLSAGRVEVSQSGEHTPSTERLQGLTPEGFESLLAQLDPDRERAGEIYETIRHKLVRLFEWRGCASRRIWRTRRSTGSPATWPRGSSCGRTSLRLLLRRRPSGLQGGPAPGLARAARPRERRMAHPHLRGRGGALRSPAGRPPPVPGPAAGRPARSGPPVLPGDERPGESNIRNRQQLAGEMGVPMNALRIRVHRVRRKLESWSTPS